MTTSVRPLIGWSGLRLIACLGIVLYHLNQLRPTEHLAPWNWDLYQFIGMLPVIVSFFFILSAVSNSMGFWRNIFLGEAVPNTGRLFVARFFRIAPAYYVALLASFGLVLAMQGTTSDMFVRMLAGVTFLSWISPVTFFPVDINGPLWYIAFDMMGVILVYSVMSIAVRIPKIWIAPFFIGVVGLLLLVHLWFVGLHFPKMEGIMSVWFPLYNPFIFGLHFMFGILISAGLVLQEKYQTRNLLGYDVGFLIVCGLMIWSLWYLRDVGDFEYSFLNTPYHFPWMTGLIALGIFLAPSTRFVGKWLDCNFCKVLAPLTYAVYLWHKVVIYILGLLLFGSHEILPMSQWWILVCLAIPLSFGIAWISHHTIEIPIVRLWKSRKNS